MVGLGLIVDGPSSTLSGHTLGSRADSRASRQRARLRRDEIVEHFPQRPQMAAGDAGVEMDAVVTAGLLRDAGPRAAGSVVIASTASRQGSPLHRAHARTLSFLRPSAAAAASLIVPAVRTLAWRIACARRQSAARRPVRGTVCPRRLQGFRLARTARTKARWRIPARLARL